jgi:hypothetical protein
VATLKAGLERATVPGLLFVRNAVCRVVVLEDIELIPVLQFEPSAFAADDRPGPSGLVKDIPEEWYRYWLECLAESGITGLVPIQRGSWHVPTREFTDLAPLRKVLEVIFQKLSENGFVDQPDGTALLGGLALRSQSQNVLIEPTCCADLGNVADWRKAAAYRQAEWQTLWIGHPWLSVRYHAPRLIICDPFEDKHTVHAGPFVPTKFRSRLPPRKLNWSDLPDRSPKPCLQAMTPTPA